MNDPLDIDREIALIYVALDDAFLAVTRIIDKLFRIATDENAFDEEPFKDIAGYAILMITGEKKKE